MLSVLRRAVSDHNMIEEGDKIAVGLSGGKDSSYLRKKLLARLELPEHMSSNAMLQALDLLFTKEELEKHILALENEYDRHSS